MENYKRLEEAIKKMETAKTSLIETLNLLPTPCADFGNKDHKIDCLQSTCVDFTHGQNEDISHIREEVLHFDYMLFFAQKQLQRILNYTD